MSTARTRTSPTASLVIAAALVVSALAARAQTPAVGDPDKPYIWSSARNLGWQFTVGPEDLYITHLGVYDRYKDGLASNHTVTLWSVPEWPVPTGSLLSSLTLLGGTAETLDGSYRWKPLATPYKLNADTTYRIAAMSLGEVQEYAYFETAYPGGLTVDPAITVEGMYDYPDDGELKYPWYEEEFILVGLGPNFKFQKSDPVPEPALLQLPLLLGLGGAGLWVRRRLSR